MNALAAFSPASVSSTPTKMSRSSRYSTARSAEYMATSTPASLACMTAGTTALMSVGQRMTASKPWPMQLVIAAVSTCGSYWPSKAVTSMLYSAACSSMILKP